MNDPNTNPTNQIDCHGVWGITSLECQDLFYHLPAANVYLTTNNLPIKWDMLSEVNADLMFQGLQLDLNIKFNWEKTSADEVDWYITAQTSLEKYGLLWTDIFG